MKAEWQTRHDLESLSLIQCSPPGSFLSKRGPRTLVRRRVGGCLPAGGGADVVGLVAAVSEAVHRYLVGGFGGGLRAREGEAKLTAFIGGQGHGKGGGCDQGGEEEGTGEGGGEGRDGGRGEAWYRNPCCPSHTHAPTPTRTLL